MLDSKVTQKQAEIDKRFSKEVIKGPIDLKEISEIINSNPAPSKELLNKHKLLLIVAASQHQWDIVNKLLVLGVDPNVQSGDLFRVPAIMYAVAHRDLATVKNFILHGANLDMHDGNSVRPIMYAARFGYTDIVRALIDAGAEGLKDELGKDSIFETFYGARCGYPAYHKPECMKISRDRDHNPIKYYTDRKLPVPDFSIMRIYENYNNAGVNAWRRDYLFEGIKIACNLQDPILLARLFKVKSVEMKFHDNERLNSFNEAMSHKDNLLGFARRILTETTLTNDSIKRSFKELQKAGSRAIMADFGSSEQTAAWAEYNALCDRLNGIGKGKDQKQSAALAVVLASAPTVAPLVQLAAAPNAALSSTATAAANAATAVSVTLVPAVVAQIAQGQSTSASVALG